MAQVWKIAPWFSNWRVTSLPAPAIQTSGLNENSSATALISLDDTGRAVVVAWVVVVVVAWVMVAASSSLS